MKTFTGWFFIITITLCGTNSYSQSGSYFPLNLDNEWTFSFQNSFHTEKIIDTASINGHLYYGLAIWTSYPQYWFREVNNYIYVLDTLTNSELLVYNFNAETGESWELIPDFNCWLGMEITLVSKTDTVITPAGTFTECYHFVHQQNCADAGVYDSWFAKGIGRIKYIEDNIAGTKTFLLNEYVISTAVKVEHESLLNFSLSQNYPNPFNPTTCIQYGVRSRELVTLKVYDILGREVVTLVNEEKQPGVYEVEFNPASGIRNLASGVYYYQLKAGNFVETKKMLLVK